MKQLAMDGDLTEKNMIEKIANLVARGRAQRDSNHFVQTDEQLLSLIDFATDKISQKE